MAEKTWAFQFAVVQGGETYAEALDAALDYLAEQAGKRELEPVSSEQIAGEEDSDAVS